MDGVSKKIENDLYKHIQESTKNSFYGDSTTTKKSSTLTHECCQVDNIYTKTRCYGVTERFKWSRKICLKVAHESERRVLKSRREVCTTVQILERHRPDTRPSVIGSAPLMPLAFLACSTRGLDARLIQRHALHTPPMHALQHAVIPFPSL